MPAPTLTTDEYFLTPETMLPQELVWGVVRDAAAPTPGHQWVVGQFYVALKDHVEQRGGRVWLSPIDVVLDRDRHLVVQPDLIVVTAAREGIVTDRVWGPPDLVIEVLSPRPRIGTLQERLDWFSQYGVRECWLVHQHARTVEVLEFSSGTVAGRCLCMTEERIQSAVLPAFSATPDSIFGGRYNLERVFRVSWKASAALALVLLVSACGRSQLSGESGGADFYRGKTVSIIVGSGAGGGFDTTARLVSRHISRHLPGEPTVIVVNMPGGGGLVAANHVFSAAAKDGTIVGLFHEAQMMNQLTGGEGVNFDLRQFNWLGSSYDDPNVCLVRTDAHVSFKGLIGRGTPIAVGGTGPGSNTYDAPRVLAAATGANIKAVAGYPTTNDVRVGVERGEIQGMCLGWESVQSASGEWLKDGYAKVIVQNGTTRLPDLQDVPLALEFAKDEDSRTLLRLVDAPAAMAKPFALPPGVDPARVQVMRDALHATYRDPVFLEEAKVMNLEFQPKTADQIQQILSEVLATPPDIAAKYRQIIQP